MCCADFEFEAVCVVRRQLALMGCFQEMYMSRGRFVLGGVLITVLLAGGLLFGQQSSTRSKGKLPRFWSKLGLSDEQKKKVGSIQTTYRVKIDALRAEISKLEANERKELAQILTDAQKQELQKIVASQALSTDPTEKKPKEEKKPVDK
jgi:hypothetical protein